MTINLEDSNNVKFFHTLADEASVGFLAFDEEDQTCIYANKMAQDLLELPTDLKLPEMKMGQLYPEQVPDPKMHVFKDGMLQMEGLFQNVLVKKFNQHHFISNLGIKKIELDDKSILLLMIQDISVQYKLQRDITEKQSAIKQAYEDLLHQNQQLKELDVAKNRFIALTTHELRTPLSAMVASSEILKLKLYDTTEEHDEFVNMIYDQGHHLLELVNDILDFAKIQANKMDFYVEEQNVVKLISSQVDALESMAESSKVTLNFKSSASDVLCYYDELRLKQVISNIINNAIKYNVENGSVEVWIEYDKKEVKVFVKDTGKGISAEDQESVFNEFETLGKVAQHSKGTGLGMPISKRLIEGLGGNIHLESEAGKGSTFWVVIPKEKVLEDECYRSRPDSNSGDLAA